MFCPNCGNDVANGASFCGHCGTPIQRSVPHPTSGQRIRVAAGSIILFLMVFILGSVVWYFFVQPDNGPQAKIAEHNLDKTVLITDTITPTQTAIQLPTDVDEPIATKTSPNVLTNTSTATLANTETSIPTPTPSLTPQPTITLTPSFTPAPTLNPGSEMFVIGRTVNDKPIEAARFGNGPQSVVFVGGLHAGFAPGTVSLAQQMVAYLEQNPEDVPRNLTVYVIISANPDSDYAPGQLNGRFNANNVDLNRNWDCNWVSDARWRGEIVRGSGGPSPFSEPETQSLRDFILGKQPVAVIFWEARAENGLVSPGNCGVRSQTSEVLATIYGTAADYPVSDFETLTNQVLNGDGADWFDQQGVPAIAVLLPQYTDSDWQQNLAGILAVLKQYS